MVGKFFCISCQSEFTEDCDGVSGLVREGRDLQRAICKNCTRRIVDEYLDTSLVSLICARIVTTKERKDRRHARKKEKSKEQGSRSKEAKTSTRAA